MTVPIIIGGTGGSGTRVPAIILKKFGYDFGVVNYAEDTLLFRHWHRKWGGLPHTEETRAEFLDLYNQQVNTVSGARWGWKSPQTIFFLKFFDSVIDFKFIHVIRNGAHMAHSTNQLPLRYWGSRFVPGVGLTPERSIKMWAIVNTQAADYGETMGDCYLRVRYEDLCYGDMPAIPKLLEFASIHQSHTRKAQSLIRPAPPKIPDSETVNFALSAMQRFGYS